MANRSFQQENYTLIAREVTLYAAVLCNDGGSVRLQQWNYPTLGTGPLARTYSQAPNPPLFPSGSAYPLNTQGGAEGVQYVSRVAPGILDIKLQNNYQRCLSVEFTVQNTTGVSSNIVVVKASDVDPLPRMTAANGSVIRVAFSTAAGAVADFPAETILLLKIVLADSTTP